MQASGRFDTTGSCRVTCAFGKRGSPCRTAADLMNGPCMLEAQPLACPVCSINFDRLAKSVHMASAPRAALARAVRTPLHGLAELLAGGWKGRKKLL